MISILNELSAGEIKSMKTKGKFLAGLGGATMVGGLAYNLLSDPHASKLHYFPGTASAGYGAYLLAKAKNAEKENEAKKK